MWEGKGMEKGDLLYEGKAKKIFSVTDSSGDVWVEFKNSLTAFNGEKKSELENKGRLNCLITSLIYKLLTQKGIETHMKQTMSDTEMVCERVDIIPLEVVVRNILAGSTAKKFNIQEGTPLEKPLVEFYYKDDSLGDPFISDDQALMLKAVTDSKDLQLLKEKALQVNTALQEIFSEVGIELIDFKLEYGRTTSNKILLADEITPDTCRLWDKKTGEKMDKDRFRRDLGNVVEFYSEIYKRLQEHWEK